ncbi:MAG: AI-2E family transporter [Nannocystaceae bacterium]
MPQLPQASAAARTLVILAAAVVIVWGLKQAGALLLPFLFAVFLSILATPVVLGLERAGAHPSLAVLVALLGVLGLLAGLGFLLTSSLTGFELALPGYRDALDVLFSDVGARFTAYGIDLDEVLRAESIDPSMVMGMAGSFVTSVIAALSNTALVVLTMVFILLEVAGLPAKLRAAMADPNADLSEFTDIMHEVQRYLVIKTVVSAVTGVIAGLILGALGVDFPVLWGLVAFLLNFIPTVGSVIAAFPPIALSLVQPGLGWLTALAVAAGYLAINTVIGNIIEPQLLGRRLGLSPLVVFLSLVFWGWVWGPVGMLLSVPLTIAARIVLERSEDLHWVAVLLGPSPEWERPPPRGSSWLVRLGLRKPPPEPEVPPSEVRSPEAPLEPSPLPEPPALADSPDDHA